MIKNINEELKNIADVLSTSTAENAAENLKTQGFKLSQIMKEINNIKFYKNLYKALCESADHIIKALGMVDKTENELIKLLRLTPDEERLLKEKFLTASQFRDFFLVLTAIEQGDNITNIIKSR